MWWKIRNQIEGFGELLALYRTYLVLLLWIVLSILLIQSNTNPQLTTVRKVILAVTAGLARYQEYLPQWIRREDYDQLRRRYVDAVKRNIILEDAYIENARLRKMYRFQQRFPMNTTVAHILTKLPDPQYHTFILHVGLKDGIRKDMNVISSRGLVGKITETYDDHSVCEIMLDERFRCAGKIQRTRLDGIIHWTGTFNEVGFYGVLKHLDVKIGDVILTSEYSDYYLPNIPVGVVVGINNEVSGLFKDIRIKTFTDFHTLEEVYVLTDTSRTIPNRPGFEKWFIRPESF